MGMTPRIGHRAGIRGRLAFGYAAVLLTVLYVGLMTPALAQSGVPGNSPPGAQQLPEGYFSFMGNVVAQLGDRYGGGWLTEEEGVSIVHLGIVAPTAEEIADIVAQSPPGLIVQVVSVRYSKQQLDGYLEQLGTIALPHGGDVVMLSARSDLNKVEVLVTAEDLPVIDEIRAAVPEDALLITVDPDAAFVALQGRPGSGLRWPIILIVVVALGGLAFLLMRRRLIEKPTDGPPALPLPDEESLKSPLKFELRRSHSGPPVGHKQTPSGFMSHQHLASSRICNIVRPSPDTARHRKFGGGLPITAYAPQAEGPACSGSMIRAEVGGTDRSRKAARRI